MHRVKFETELKRGPSVTVKVLVFPPGLGVCFLKIGSIQTPLTAEEVPVAQLVLSVTQSSPSGHGWSLTFSIILSHLHSINKVKWFRGLATLNWIGHGLLSMDEYISTISATPLF